jgi:hypothetical protein
MFSICAAGNAERQLTTGANRACPLHCDAFMGVMTTTHQLQPQFLRIRWEATNEETEEAVTLEASLCLVHRREIALNSSARPAGQFGESCDLCAGQQPSRVRESHLSLE